MTMREDKFSPVNIIICEFAVYVVETIPHAQRSFVSLGEWNFSWSTAEINRDLCLRNTDLEQERRRQQRKTHVQSQCFAH